jgi:glycerophosphoryl diester phosphodiesterase
MNFLELFNRKNLYAAHRGLSSLYPENTMSALRGSIGHCDFIEIDVQLSKDAQPVIIHDDTLDRTTNYKGRVCDFNLDELRKLDYGDGEKLLTLHDALKFVKEHKLYINVEIKDIHNNFNDELVVGTILELIKSLDVQEQVLISSFRHEYLPLCKKRLNIPTAALVENTHPKNLIKYLKDLGVDSYHLNDELVDVEVVKELKEAGFFVNVYTIDDKKRAKELFDMGVNGIFTNKKKELL